MMCQRPDGGIGRRRGLKIPWPVKVVWVRVPLGAPNSNVNLYLITNARPGLTFQITMTIL